MPMHAEMTRIKHNIPRTTILFKESDLLLGESEDPAAKLMSHLVEGKIQDTSRSAETKESKG